MSAWDRLNAADDWLFAVGRQVGKRVAVVGQASWNTSPGQARARERAWRLMDRAARRVGTETRSLVETAGLPESVVLAHLHDRNRARDARLRGTTAARSRARTRS